MQLSRMLQPGRKGGIQAARIPSLLHVSDGSFPALPPVGPLMLPVPPRKQRLAEAQARQHLGCMPLLEPHAAAVIGLLPPGIKRCLL